MITPGHWSRRRLRWNSIGSAAFALTVLAVLGLGGGFLLALLPFNSAEHSTTAARYLRDLPALPTKPPTPSSEIVREADISDQRSLGADVASNTVSATDGFELSQHHLQSAAPVFSAGSLSEELGPRNIEMAVPTFTVASSPGSTRIPATAASVGAFEAEQIAVVPEPATWRLLISAMLAFVLLVRRRKNSRASDPNFRR